MLKNYFLTSIRSLRKNTFFLLVNIIGISIAIAICIVGYFNFYFNDSFNNYFENADHLYKVNGERTGKSMVGSSPIALGEYLQNKGFQSMQFASENCLVKVTGENREDLYRQSIAFVDEGFLKEFQFPDQNGTPTNNVSKKDVIITEQTAIRLFGSVNAIGKLMKIVSDDGKHYPFRVSNVLAKVPQNTSFQFSMVISIDNYPDLKGIEIDNWNHRISGTFIKINSSDDTNVIVDLNASLEFQKELPDGITVDKYRLDDLYKWPAIESELFERSFRGHLHPASVMGTISSAIAILLLACFNFVNTSIAVSGRRLKEIGMRKVFGSSKWQVIFQFMMENFLLILAGIILSIFFVSLLIPTYNALFEFEVVELEHVPWSTFLFLGAVLLITVTLLSGAYPAFYLSGLSSLSIFRNQAVLSGRNIFSKVLLSFQFMLCFYNLFSLFVFVENAEYQEQMDRGYAIRSTINVPLNVSDRFDLFRNELLKEPDIQMISGTEQIIGFGIRNESLVYEGVDIYPERLKVGPDYLRKMDVSLVKGEWFEKSENQNKSEIIINQLFENQLGKEMLHETLWVGDQQMKVIGVVENFNTGSIILDNKMEPLLISESNEQDYKYLVANSENLTNEELNDVIEEKWYSLFPDDLYTGFEQEKVMKPVRTTNKITISINSFIALISIIISIMGLYSLVSLIAIRRRKEFGIRKVLGGSQLNIAKQLWNEFSIVIPVAAILGLLLGNYVISMLLDIIFAYHIDVSWNHSVYPIVFMLVIIIGSIGYKILKTVSINPSEQLRTE